MALKLNWKSLGPAAQGIYDVSTTQKCDLGAVQVLGERVFRYGKAGGTALAAGKLMQRVVAVANHSTLTCAAAAIDATSVTVTLGATLASLNQYAEGYLNIEVTPGQGHIYKVKTHPAAAASATLALTLYDGIRVALTTASRASLATNPYDALIIHPSPPTARVIGVPAIALAASEFGWFQTWGPCSVLSDGTPGAGIEVSASDAVDGAVEVYAVATGQKVGIVEHFAGVDTTYALVYLMLDPGY